MKKVQKNGGGDIDLVEYEQGQCACASGFSGPTCSTCNGEISWIGGTPYCS